MKRFSAERWRLVKFEKGGRDTYRDCNVVGREKRLKCEKELAESSPFPLPSKFSESGEK
jgi:hypothetical protein